MIIPYPTLHDKFLGKKSQSRRKISLVEGYIAVQRAMIITLRGSQASPRTADKTALRSEHCLSHSISVRSIASITLVFKNEKGKCAKNFRQPRVFGIEHISLFEPNDN